MSRALRLVAAVNWAALCVFGAPARVWQDTLQLPTYAEHEADPLPEFAAFQPEMPNYPYPVRRGISRAPEDRSEVRWRTLNLENEYLSCRILPDLGGHVYSCRDKLNKREMFYANPVMKKDLIGLRGAWIATGVEPNFPVTHSRGSASPVNFAMRTYADGSAAVIVANSDLVTGLRWRVEYRLRPETAVLEEQVSFYNPTPVRKPYEWWNNAQIEWDDPGIRYIIPARLVVQEDPKLMETWPVDRHGVDISVAANYKEQTAWFAYQSREPFMAVYKPRSRSGVVHYADPERVTGKKLWVMGDQLEFYRQRLTDHANMYVEMQAGLFQDQREFEFLQPEQSRTFREFWIPFRDLDGLTRATPDAALYARRSAAAEVAVEVEVTHPAPGARIRLISGTRVVSEVTVDLSPKTVWTGTAKLAPGESYAVQVLDANQRVLLEHEENHLAASGPAEIKPGPRSAPDWSHLLPGTMLRQLAEYNEEHGYNLWAFKNVHEGLEADDSSLAEPAGRLDLRLLRPEEAVKHLREALARSPGDAETLYYAGVADSLTRNDSEARVLLEKVLSGKAGVSGPFARAASVELALLAARGRDFAGALKKLTPPPEDPLAAGRIGGLRVAILRRGGERAAASREAAKWLALAPENLFLRHEAVLAGIADPALWTYLAGDGERVLDLADEYLRLGLVEDALTLLNHDFSADASAMTEAAIEPGAVPPPRNAMAVYYRAYCQSLLKIDPAANLRRASELGARYMFPSRLDSYQVLESALAANPTDGTAHALLGNLEMYSFRTEDALADWRKAAAVDPKLVDARTIAQAEALLVKKAEPVRTAVKMKTARPTAAAPPAAVPVPARTIPAAPAMAGAPPARLAETAMLNSIGNAADSASVFHRPDFAAEKQPDEVRQAFIEVRLQSILAMSAARQCEAMRDRIEELPVFEDTSIPFTFYGFAEFIRKAHFQFYLGLAEANCGRAKEARKRWSKVAKMHEAPDSPDFGYPLLAASRLDPAEAGNAIAEAGKELSAQTRLDASLRDLNQGLLLRAAGEQRPAQDRLLQAAKSGSGLIRYLAAVELARASR